MSFFMFLAVLGLFVVMSVIRDRHVWNNGVCRESGLPWVPFDTDSSGATGYKDGAGNVCWLYLGPNPR